MASKKNIGIGVAALAVGAGAAAVAAKNRKKAESATVKDFAPCCSAKETHAKGTV